MRIISALAMPKSLFSFKKKGYFPFIHSKGKSYFGLVLACMLALGAFWSAPKESGVPFPLPEVQVAPDGRAVTSIGIPVPPGPAKFVPSISLSYDSQMGNGFLGMGWSLGGFGQIKRDSTFGSFTYTSADHFISTEDGELEALTVSQGGGYHAKRETFRKYTPIAGCGDVCSWSVKEGNGTTSYYGELNGTSAYNSRVVNASNQANVWGLNRIVDKNGNTIEILYHPQSQTDGVLYPQYIRYNGGASEIEFVWIARADWVRSWIGGSSVTQTRLLDEIITRFQSSETDSWEFSYGTDASNRRILTSIERDKFAPLTLTYNMGTLDLSQTPAVVQRSSAIPINAKLKYSDLGACLSHFTTCAMTMFGANPVAAIMCALGHIQLGNDCADGISSNIGFFGDVNGDKVLDYIRIVTEDFERPYIGIGGIAIDNTMLEYRTAALQVNFGKKDSSGITSLDTAEHTILKTTPFRFTDGTQAFPADVDGNGMADIVFIEDYGSKLKVYLSTGTGFSVQETNVTSTNPKPAGGGAIIKYLSPDRRTYNHLADLNGDGRTDFIQYNPADSKTYVYYSTGTGFDGGRAITGITDYGVTNQMFVDLDENGIPDFITYDRIDNDTARRMVYTLFGENQTVLYNGSLTLGTEGKFDNFYFSDLNSDGLQDLAVVLPLGDINTSTKGTLKTYYFDSKEFGNPQVFPLYDLRYKEDTNKFKSAVVADPYELDLRRDVGPGDVLYLSGGRLELLFHDNASSYDIDLFLSLENPDPPTDAEGNPIPMQGVGQYDAESILRDIDKDGANDTLWVRVFVDGDAITDITLMIKYSTGPSEPVAYDLDWGKLQSYASMDPNAANWPALSQSTYDSWRMGIFFADYNGDGRNDTIWCDGSNIRVAYSKPNGTGGLSFAQYGDISPIPSSFLNQAADLNGDTRADLISIESALALLEYPANLTHIRSNVPFAGTGNITFTNTPVSLPAGTLASISTSKGTRVDITYDWEAKLPETKIASSVFPSIAFPVPKYVTTKVLQTFPNASQSSTEFTYNQHRFYNGTRNVRRDLGYSSVKQVNKLGNLIINGKEDFYFQGVDFYTDGLVSRTVESSRGQTVRDTTYTCTSNLSFFSTNFGRCTDSVSTVYVNGSPHFTITGSIIYDPYGNVRQRTTTLPGYTLTEDIQYLNDNLLWNLGMEIVFTRRVNGVKVEDRALTYVDNKNISSIQTFPGTTEANYAAYFYDTYGNVIETRDGFNRSTFYEYDTASNSYLIKATNPLLHVTEYVYDIPKGLLLEEKTPNGQSVVREYDDFGRMVQIIQPGETEDWTERYLYEGTGGLNPTLTRVVKDSVNGEVQTKQYFDSMGRVIREETTLAQGKILASLTEYDAYGAVKRKSSPYLQGLTSPIYSEYTYDANGNLIKITNPEGTYSEITAVPDGSNGNLTTTNTMFSAAGVQVSTATVVTDSSKRILSKNSNGLLTSYGYDSAGRQNRITDPAGNLSTLTFYPSGRRRTFTDQNSGTTNYEYDTVGNVTRVRTASGKNIDRTYDALNRLLTVTGGVGTNISYTYDLGTNGIGRLSNVVDPTGSTAFEYSESGDIVRTTKTVDSLTFVLEREYDNLHRPVSTRYPDGSIVRNKYELGGYLSQVAMDVPDWSSLNHPVVSYVGPGFSSDGNLVVTRTTGNGVITEISVDPVHLRTSGYKTTLKNGTVRQSVKVNYDDIGNITKIENLAFPSETQDFTYDTNHRLISATGSFGTENYTYDPSGNMTAKADKTLSYSDANHVNAVTSVTSPSLGTMTYSYDTDGNMVSRNGDTLIYDAYGTLKEVQTYGGQNYKMYTDFTGARVKKRSENDNVDIYTVFGIYELQRVPSQPDKHTLYIHGAKGETVSQLTRTDAVLVAASEPDTGMLYAILPFLKNGGAVLKIGTMETIAVLFSPEMWTKVCMGSLGIILLGWTLFTIFQKVSIREENSWALPFAPILVTAILIQSGCGIIPTGGSGTAPWVAGAAAIAADVPSVNSPNPTAPGGFTNVPVPGMYFYHADQLGSLTMLTDGAGLAASGGEMPGTSNIKYKPYGEIDRANSAGPDISARKYAGQLEDRETGLYFSGARYYDPETGRFLQADSQLNPETMGLNRYMYVNGNPISFRDPGGHNAIVAAFNDLCAAIFGSTKGAQLAFQYYVQQSNDPVLKILAGFYQKVEEKRMIRRMRDTQIFKTVVAAVVAVALIVATWGAATPAVVTAEGVVTGGSLLGNGLASIGLSSGWTSGIVSFAANLGASAAGYAIGSSAGYIVGGYTGTGGRWNESTAIRGAQLGGGIGSAITPFAAGKLGLEFMPKGLSNSTEFKSSNFEYFEQSLGKFGYGMDATISGGMNAGRFLGRTFGEFATKSALNWAATTLLGGFVNFTWSNWDFSGYNLKESMNRRNSEPEFMASGFFKVSGDAWGAIGSGIYAGTGFNEVLNSFFYGL
ncbi:RHS repeat-associated core domain-containing protein [Leptospira sp. id769339]|uniref:RHS repeat-associated core domain-containing protein n=1 Tax=Leptospira sp. id769339 TaxID=2864221 RepID=UPI00214B9FFF|nr:RHS repeat-associated core domain-containing protein [Leptospira sp. id769339]MCR1793774.1 FG-GAP-like repeat-containing protein [Leptospira sp. id769339]